MAETIIGKIEFRVNNDRCKCNGDGSLLCQTCLRNLTPCGEYQTFSQFAVLNGRCDEFIEAYPKQIEHKLKSTITKKGNRYTNKKSKETFIEAYRKEKANKNSK